MHIILLFSQGLQGGHGFKFCFLRGLLSGTTSFSLELMSFVVVVVVAVSGLNVVVVVDVVKFLAEDFVLIVEAFALTLKDSVLNEGFNQSRMGVT